MSYFGHLLYRHLTQYPARVVTSLFVLTVASAMMLALAGAGMALQFRLGGYLAQLFPEERVWLEASRSAFGPIAVEARPITDETLTAIQPRPEVERVWPIEPIRFPISVSGNLFGQEITSEAVIYGVSRDLVADAFKPGQSWAKPAKADENIPLVVSSYFLDLYNLGLARSSGLPLLSPSLVIGRHVTVGLGASAVGLGGQRTNAREARAVVLGFTAQPAMIGLAMPEDVVRDFNQEFNPGTPRQFVKLVVQLKKGADREAFLQFAGTQGLTLAGGDALADKIKKAVRIAGWVLIALAVGVFLLGMLTFYLLFTMIFHARRLDLIRLRAMGCTPREVVALALGEVGSIALVAVVVAGSGVAGAAWYASKHFGPMLSQLSWLPPGLLAPSTAWLVTASVVILVATLLPALPMLRWVVTVEPASVIRDM